MACFERNVWYPIGAMLARFVRFPPDMIIQLGNPRLGMRKGGRFLHRALPKKAKGLRPIILPFNARFSHSNVSKYADSNRCGERYTQGSRSSVGFRPSLPKPKGLGSGVARLSTARNCYLRPPF